MTFEEKLSMWREKRKFIQGISNIFQTTKHNSTVESVSYEVYEKQFEERTGYGEWVVIHFTGGAIIPIFVTGNSNTANFRIIGEHLNGGYYSEVETYKALFSNGWKMIIC